MKLQKNKKKRTTIVLAALVILAVIVGVLTIILAVNAEKQEADNRNIIRGISIVSIPAKTEYYVGETFDPTGTEIQVLTNSSDYVHFVEWNQLTFEGFDSSVANDKVTITVSYQGYTTKFDVVVKEPQLSTPTLVGIEVYNFETTYSKSEWNTYGPKASGGRIRCIYSDGSVVEDIVLKSKYIYGVVESDVGTTEITVKYSDGVTTVELPITITITN